MPAEKSPSDYYLDVGPKFLREAYNDLVDLVFAFQPLAGTGLLRNDTPKGRLLSANISTASLSGLITPTPWEMISVLDGSTPKCQVNPYSYLFKQVADGKGETIANLSDKFIPTVGQYAWLELSQNGSGALTAIEFMHGAPWPAFPADYTIDSTDPDNPFIDSVYIPLAAFLDPNTTVAATDYTPGKTFAVGSAQIKSAQLLNEHLIIVNRAIGGLVGEFVEHWHGIA